MRLRQLNYGNHPRAQSSSRLKLELLRSGQQTAGRTRHSSGNLTGDNEDSSEEKMRHAFTKQLYAHLSSDP